MQKHYYLLPFFLLTSVLLHATHNRSGEIIFRKTGGLGVEATIVTYTRASSVNADRDSLDICWGDGTCTRIARSNGNGLPIGMDLKQNIYKGIHTYLTQGDYRISMTDYNRTGGILNINPPMSENVPFHLEATVRMMPDAQGSTNSPIFLEPPVDIAYAFQPYAHTPNAFDLDGDSLAYELLVAMADTGLAVPNYLFPNEVSPSADNKIFFNPLTGEFYWASPIQPGSYTIALLVKSYQNGILVETTLRDMAIEVLPQANHAPMIALVPNIDSSSVLEVSVGQTLVINVNASDSDAGQQLALSASGGPFEAVFQGNATFTVAGSSGVFTWQIGPEYLRDQPYQIVFKAKDDYFGDGLAAIRVVRIRVVAATDVRQPVTEIVTLNISPNPAPGKINIEWPLEIKGAETLQLFDAGGSLIRSIAIPSGINQYSMETTGLAPGVYFIEIQTIDGKRMTGRLLKI